MTPWRRTLRTAPTLLAVTGCPLMRRRAMVLACALLVLLPPLTLAPYLGGATELVRLRNALLLDDAAPSDFDWTPATRPPSFRVEAPPYDPFFVAIAARLRLEAFDDDWSRAVAIAAHLLSAAKPRVDGAIQSDLRTTYGRIVDHGEGYCADFVRTFNALAIAAGMQVRSWAFSFDGFGGHGHVFSEVWNRRLRRWQLVDPFNNYAFVDDTGQPVAGLALREYVGGGTTGSVHMRPLVAGAATGYSYEDKAWQYYRAGAAQWYLWWGEHPFTYDRAAGVRAFEGVSRSLAQLAGIVQGVHPRIRIVPTPAGAAEAQALQRLRVQLIGVAVLVACGLAGLAVAWAASRRRSGT